MCNIFFDFGGGYLYKKGRIEKCCWKMKTRLEKDGEKGEREEKREGIVCICSKERVCREGKRIFSPWWGPATDLRSAASLRAPLLIYFLSPFFLPLCRLPSPPVYAATEPAARFLPSFRLFSTCSPGTLRGRIYIVLGTRRNLPRDSIFLVLEAVRVFRCCHTFHLNGIN